ncbi:uncharacterized protein PV09_05030 [Verruconis gallopava]|uniref:RRM domain-containing protein n=1 Tax=Verruconis gallopava TaxID=253628 RepID=A0A0D1XMI3_9PEZI|nr:uncharacterized protein PV09_05030 [Verruconis gallopava]KIW03721.1 hypothetical protein PV09_05030 [Verruconis gallopava]
MAPKKQTQKMSLGDFLGDQSLGSWADEMEDMPVAPAASDRPGYGGDRRAFSSAPSFGGDRFGTDRGGDRDRGDRSFAPRQQLPLPTKPPFTAHLGNLPFDATSVDIEDIFANCEIINVRLVEDRLDRKPKGFGYAEFRTLEGLKKALDLNGTPLKGRDIRVSVADPPKDRPEARELNDWTRKGPLPDLPQQQQRRASERTFGSGYEAPPMERGGSRRSNFNDGDGKVRDLNNWERKGPLSPVPAAAAPQGRDGGRTREPRERKLSPSWGEGTGRSSGSQDGSRPPRREFAPRPPERQPTAAERDTQWRAKMRPDPPAQSTSPTPEPSVPSSPAQPAPPATRPKLNLAKRTVSESQPAEPISTADSKSSPFGAARPIDTAAREREVAEKRELALRLKREADEKAREEKKAREAAAKEEAEAANENGKANGQKENGDATRPGYQILARENEGGDDDAEGEGEPAGRDATTNGEVVDDKAAKPREFVREPPRGPKAERRGGAAASGDWRRKPSAPATPASPKANNTAESLEEDGWSTVPSKQRGRGRGGARAVAS